MFRDMKRHRKQFPQKIHRHRLHLSIKWRGRRPRKAVHDDDSSSTSDDSDSGNETGGVLQFPLDDRLETPRSSLLRARYIVAECRYWGDAELLTTFMPHKTASSEECTCLEFAPKGHLLACGTLGGGLLVYHCGGAERLTLIRALRKAPSDAPNGVLTARWSFDCAEVLTTDAAGTVRVWCARQGSTSAQSRPRRNLDHRMHLAPSAALPPSAAA